MAFNQNVVADELNFVPPVSWEVYQSDAAEVFLFYMRSVGMMTTAAKAWAMLTSEDDVRCDTLFKDCSAAEMGITFFDIQKTPFGESMKQLYDYACFGKVYQGKELIDYASGHTWVASLVADCANSAVAREWESYGLDVCEPAARCTLIMELANARLILEGGEPFYYPANADRADASEAGVLTVRQVAQLASMKEMSIRAAANPNGPNRLTPTKRDGGTRFEIAVVKDWLQRKNRYVPIQNIWPETAIDLSTHRFGNREEAASLLSRCLAVQGNPSELVQKLNKLGVRVMDNKMELWPNLDEELRDGGQRVRELALLLNQSETLLALRLKELVAREQLNAIESELYNIVNHTN